MGGPAGFLIEIVFLMTKNALTANFLTFFYKILIFSLFIGSHMVIIVRYDDCTEIALTRDGIVLFHMRIGVKMDIIQVFYSYSQDDEKYRKGLEKHLSVLRRQGLIKEWYFRKILPGQDWENEIDMYLEQSQIVLLLISASFIASEYCYGRELKRAIELHDEGRAVVIPVIVRQVDWMYLPFSKLQALPTDGRPISKWHDQEEALADITKGIRAVIAKLQQKVVV